MRQAPARPEQTQFPNYFTSIVSDALRGAALAPDLATALDIAGAALANIAGVARGEIPAGRSSSETSIEDDALQLACKVADEALEALSSVTSILEAVERLSFDNDAAICDLATLGREIVAKQYDRLDLAFTGLAHRSATQEMRHG